MAQDLWEGSELVVRATLAAEPKKPYTDTVDLLFVKNGNDDQPLATAKGLALTGGALEHRYTLPKVAPDEPNYALKVIALHGQDKATRSDVAEAVVWPKSITVHTKTDQRAHEPKTPLAVVQGSVETPLALTGDDGRCTGELTAKAPYSLKTLAPYALVSDETTPAKLREHQLTVERTITAMFVSPDVKAAPYVPSTPGASVGHRQYVNLVTAKNGQDSLGHEVLIEVCANPRSEGRAGDRIHVQVEFSRASLRNQPLPTLMSSPAVNALATPADQPHTGWVALDADGGTAKFKVNLGLAGGDDCKVSIGGRKAEVNDASLTLVNWRKLYYQLRYPAMFASKLSDQKDFADDLKHHVTARLGQAFIEFEMSASIEFPDSDATIAKGNGTMMPAAYLKESGSDPVYMVSPGILNATGKFQPGAASEPRSVYISLCDRSFSGNVDAHTLAPLITSATMELPSPSGYLFEPPPAKGRATNVSVAGYSWEAVVEHSHDQATALDLTEAATAPPGQVVLSLPAVPGRSLTIAFAALPTAGHDTALSPLDKGKLEQFVQQQLADQALLRQHGNRLGLLVSTDGSGGPATARSQAVKAAVQDKFKALDTKVSMHPGLDHQGHPRTGPMDKAWITFKDYETILVTLPTSPGTAADKVLPGDFVGPAETDTQCKVRIKFDCVTAGSINGNSGGGYQILKLRDGSAAAVSSTICHELGHSMGMTIVPGSRNDVVPPGLTAKHIDNGGTSYFNGDAPYAFNDGKRSIHKGGHCAFNVPTAKVANHKFSGWSPSSSTVGCIMWGSGGTSDRRPAFCPTCLDLLKARRLDDVRSAFAGRGADQG